MPVDGQSRPQVSQRLGYAFKHASLALADLHAEALAPFGIDARELGVLIVIDSHEPASQQQIAQRLGVDRTTMVTNLDTLEARGILARQPDSNDRRRNLVALTDAGQDLLRRATAASDGAERELLAPLNATESEQLRDLLTRVIAAAEQ